MADAAVEEVNHEWQTMEEMVMLDVCRQKYKTCKHAKTALLESRSELAEATGDKKWGTGLNVKRTQECLPDFWPGRNMMGKILKTIRTELLEEKHLQLIDYG